MSGFVPRFYGFVEYGKIQLDAKKRFASYIKNLEGQEIELVVQKRKEQRTINQNRFYWLYLRLLEDETGDLANNLHELFKRVLLPPRQLKVMGKIINVPGSTTELDPKEFSEYMEKIQKLTGVPIPNTEDISL